MKTVTYSDYMDDLTSFIRMHNKSDYRISTSELVNNQYVKTYAFEDGSAFCEVNQMDTVEEVEVDAHGLTFTAQIHVIKHEYWSTDFGSRYWYEKR